MHTRIGCGTFIVGSLLLPWTVPLSMKAITTADSISSRKDMHPLSIVSTSDTKRMHNRTLDFRWIQHVNNNSFFNSIKHSHNSSYDYSFDYRYNSLGEDITQLKDWILSIPTNCLVLFQWISIAPGFIYQAIGNATGLTHRSLSSSSTGSSASGYSLPALALTTVSPSPLDVTVDTPLSALLSTSSFVALDSIAEETIVSLILPCTLLALIVGASYLCRKASMILLQVALTPVFAEPKGMVRMITNIVDVAVRPDYNIFRLFTL